MRKNLQMYVISFLFLFDVGIAIHSFAFVNDESPMCCYMLKDYTAPLWERIGYAEDKCEYGDTSGPLTDCVLPRYVAWGEGIEARGIYVEAECCDDPEPPTGCVSVKDLCGNFPAKG